MSKWWSVGVLALTLQSLGVASTVQAASLNPSQRITIAATMGSNTAKHYCGGFPLSGAIERGMMQTLVSENLPASAMDQINLEDKEIGIAFFENFLADSFAQCPGRARAIWRQIVEM
ncbi:MAG: hypothetical protein ACPHGV_09460 [Synechococcus sp.]